MNQALHKVRTDIEQMLKEFPARADDLKKVKRYTRYPRMHYRTDLHVHGKRIASSLIYAMPTIMHVFPNFDAARAITIALVHDDAELVTGDFQSSNRVLMSSEQLAALESDEARAIEVIAAQYPDTVYGFNYRTLLRDVLEVSSLEAQVVKYLDKFEGYAEAMHEIFAGNGTFLERPPTEYGAPPNPFEYYGGYFADIMSKYPALAPMIVEEHPFFDPRFVYDWEAAAENGQLHSLASLESTKGFHHYDHWVSAQRTSDDQEIIDSLLILREN